MRKKKTVAEYLREGLRVWVIPEEWFDLDAARAIQISLDTS